MAKRLLERGYRVKCMAMGSAQEILEEQLSRLSTLMEDYSIVENGPKVDKKGAWLIVKHIKFGRAKKNEAQETTKLVETSTSEMERGNSNETSESENKKLDRVVFPEGVFKRECSQFEEYAPLEKFKEFASEEVSSVDRIEEIPNADALLTIDTVEGIPSADALLISERNNKISSLNEEFKEECVSIEEKDTTEYRKDFAAEEVPCIDRVQEVPANFLLSSEREMHTNNALKEEPVVVDSINYTETKAKLGNLNASKHDDFDQPMETLSNTHSVLHHHNASNTGKQFPLDRPFKQSLGSTKAKDIEILKQEHSALHMSANLSNGPAEQDQLENYKHKQSVPVNASRQVIFGKIHSDQGRDVSNVEKPQTVDSVSESASGSIMANAKDATDDHKIHGSTVSVLTSTIFEDIQTSPIKLNHATPSKDQQKMTNSTPKISAASLRQALVNRSSGNQEKTGKRPLADILPKKANESRWAILKQVKPAHFDGNKNSSQISEVTSNIVEELQISPATLNNVTAAQDSHSISVGSAQISVGGLRQVLANSNSDDKEGASETGKWPLENLLSKKVCESRGDILGHHKPSCFDGNNNTTTSEIKSNIFEKVQTSALDLNNYAATQDQQNVAISSHQIASESLGQVLGNCSSNNQEISVSERGKEPLIDTILRKHSEPQQATFKQIKPSNSEDKNIVANVQLEFSNVECHAVRDDTRQDPPYASPSNKGHDISNIGKQIPLASESVPAKVLFETNEIFPQGQFLAINANEDATTQSEIGVKVLKQAISSEHKNLPLSGVQVISNPLPRDPLEIPSTKSIPWDDGRKVPTGENPIGRGKHSSVTGKQPPSNSLSEQASVSGGSCWGVFSQPKSCVVETQRHPAKSTENQSNPSSFDNYKDATTTIAATSNGNLKKCVPEKEKQPLANLHPEKASESQSTTFTWIKPSHFEGDDNTTTQDQPRVSNSNYHSNSDNTKQNHYSSNSQGDNISNVEKQIPVASDSTPVKVLEETYSILSYGQSSAVDVNGASPMQTENRIQNTKLTIPSEHKKQDLSGIKSILGGHSAKKEVTQKSVDLSPKPVSKTGVSTYGISKQLPLSSVRVNNTAMPRDSLEIPNYDTIQWDDARKAPAVDSPRDQGNHASFTGKQSPNVSYPRQASVTGGSRWGIFSQQKGSVLQNQRDPVKMSQYQSKEPNIIRETNIGASIETQSDAEPRHLHIQTQMKVPISGTGTPKLDLLQTENKIVTEPKQKGWGIFSKKVPTKHLDTKEKSEL
ncbi:uncharacterized protein LOC131031262 isoform X2 [Cryptomeria japonica]|nr:uncharacterized protein LOC131031262 isoform X2 [Cryptomeria japonica]